jgi:hypothetical protein
MQMYIPSALLISDAAMVKCGVLFEVRAEILNVI